MHNRKFIGIIAFFMVFMSAVASFAAAIYDNETFSTSFDVDLQAYFESQGYDMSIGDYIVSGEAGMWSVTDAYSTAFLASNNRAVVRTLPKVMIRGDIASESADYVIKVRYAFPLNTATRVISGNSLLEFYPEGLTVISDDGNYYAQATGTATFLDATGKVALTDAMVMQIARGELGTVAGDGVTQYYDGYIVMRLAKQEDGEDPYRPVIVVKRGGVAVNEANFPDEVFRAYVLSADTSFDKNQDGTLSDAELAAVTTIDVNSKGISSLKGIEYFTALTYLVCYGNQLTSLDVSGCTALTTLSCGDNSLGTLDVSGCTALTTLYCNSNQLTSLDVSGCTALTRLNCGDNPLGTLDVSNNTALTYLFCYSNQLTSLDVSRCTALTTLDCWDNKLTTLDVSTNTALTHLDCTINQLTALDVSKNTALTGLYCDRNQLTALDVSKNTALYEFRCYSNQLTALDLSNNTALWSLECYSQTVSVDSPDTTGDSSYPYSLSFSALSDSLDISRVYSLDVRDYYGNTVNFMTDTSSSEQEWMFNAKPKTMTYYYYTGHSGSYMDVTATLAGEADSSAYVPVILTESLPNGFDGVYYSADILASGAEPLTWELISGDLHKSGLSLDSRTGRISGTPPTLGKESKQSFAVRVSNTYGSADPVKFTIVFQIPPAIKTTELPEGYAGTYYSADIKAIGSKTITYSADNLPSWLTLDSQKGILSGTPPYVGTYTFTVTASNSAGSDTRSFSLTVNAGSSWTAITESAFPDSAFRSYITASYDINGDGYLSDSERAGVTRLDISGLSISDLTGIENFTALVSLDCHNNGLTGTLDLSANTALVYLNCSENYLTALNVSSCTLLGYLNCWGNQLTALNVNNNTVLTNLLCGKNLLTELDVSNNHNLTELLCNYSRLTALDVSNNTALEFLDFGSNDVTALDVSNNIALKTLVFGQNQFTALDVSNNTNLENLDFSDNHITAVDLSNNVSLNMAHCASQVLTYTSLDITGIAALPYSINLNSAKAILGISIDIPDFVANVSELEILDANGPITHSTDIPSGIVYFPSKPEYISYIYNTGYSGSNGSSMDVAITISSDITAPAFSITLTPATQTITQGDSITPIAISSVMASGDISYTAESLPEGLTLSADTKTISGAISTVGTYTFTVTATDAAGSTASATATITVNPPYVTPSGISGIAVTSPAEKSITLDSDGGTFSATLSATGEAYGSIVWTASATQGLTATITGSGSTATLSGTAQANTSSQDISGTITITAHDDYNTNYSDTLTVIISGVILSEDITSGDITSQDISIDVTITGIAFTPESVNLSADGGLVSFTAAVEGTPSGDVTWDVGAENFSVSPQTGLTVSITGNVAPNTTSNDITHTVRVTARDSIIALSSDFTVIVAGIPYSENTSGDNTESDDHSGTESEDHHGGDDNPNDDDTPYYEKTTGDSWADAYVMVSYSDFMNLLERFFSGSESAGKYYAIDADIDMSNAANFQAIGSESNPFRGHFNGNGKTITIPANVRGLFGLVDTDGTAVQNLNVQTAPSLYNRASGNSTPPTEYAGGIVQELANGTIADCTFSGSVIADGEDSSAGGIVGLLSGGTIQNCRVLSGSGIYASHSAGGIAGYVTAGSISGCDSGAKLDAEFSGGIAGYTESDRGNINTNTFTGADFEVGNDALSLELVPESQTVRAGDTITDIYVSSDNTAVWSFRVSGNYAIGLTSSDMNISGRISAGLQPNTYTIIVNAINSNGFTASAQASITVIRGNTSESGDIASGDNRPHDPGRQENSVNYTFEIPSGVKDRVAMRFGNETVYQFTDDEIFAQAWNLDAEDIKAIADMYESVALYLPILRPKNSGTYLLRLDLSGAVAGKNIKLYGITSGSEQLNASALENMDYVLLDEEGNEITQVPENGIVYAALRLTANREHRGVITTPIELERGTIQPVEPEETLLEKIAESVNISADKIMFITEKNISDPQEPTQAIRSELESRKNQIIGKFNTITVETSGYYVFKVTLSDDLYEQIKNVSINELNVYALFDDERPASGDIRASFVSGLVSTWELLSLNGEKLEFGVKEFLMVGFLNAGTPFSVYLTKLIIMILLGGCDSGIGIAGLAVMALGAIFFIRRMRH